jgi:3D (Asp-Asp-Asp) domain-containing protein
MRPFLAATIAPALLLALACARPAPTPPQAPAPPPRGARSAVVTASAYNSHPDQTDGDPFLTASGERLQPGMKALAVSADLFADGLDFGTRVRIEGMDGEWVVLDRLPSGRRRSIDLYFGLDEEAALRFGRKRVRIDW